MVPSFLSMLLSWLVLVSASTCVELRIFSRQQCKHMYFPSNNLYQRPLTKKSYWARFCANPESFQDCEVDSIINNNVDILYTNFDSTIKLCELDKFKMKASSSKPFLNAKPIVTKFRSHYSEIVSNIYSTLPYISSGTKSFLQGLRDNWLIVGEILVIAVQI